MPDLLFSVCLAVGLWVLMNPGPDNTDEFYIRGSATKYNTAYAKLVKAPSFNEIRSYTWYEGGVRYALPLEQTIRALGSDTLPDRQPLRHFLFCGETSATRRDMLNRFSWQRFITAALTSELGQVCGLCKVMAFDLRFENLE